jgi:cell division protein FtsL
VSPTEPGVDRRTGTAAGGLADAPAREGQDQEEQRRHLRLVQTQARRRAGRRRLLVALGISIVAVVCLALVALHVLIAENQFKLDRLQQQASTEQASYEKLRLQVAELEAPARIVSEAEGQLGMVQPASVTYLPAISSASTTSPASDHQPAADRAADGRRAAKAGVRGAGKRGSGAPAAADPPPANTVTAPQGDSDWPSIKPYLSGSP